MLSKNEADDLRANVEAYFRDSYRPGQWHFTSIICAVANPATDVVAMAGPIYDDDGFPTSRIALVAQGQLPALLNEDKFSDSDPKWSPDGQWLAFLTDRGQGAGNFQLHLADAAAPSRQRPTVTFYDQVVESHSWSPDGRRILIQTADAGADSAGSASLARVGTSGRASGPAWAPSVTTGEAHGWRHAYVWDCQTETLISIGTGSENVWEAAWCGDAEIAAILSGGPGEGDWYHTYIGVAPAEGGAFAHIVAPSRELGGICGSPNGSQIAVIEGRFHRGLPLGDLVLYDRRDGSRFVPSVDAQVSSVEWRDDDTLFYAGFDAPDMVVGDLHVASRKPAPIWRSTGAGGRKVPSARPMGPGGALVPAHAFNRYHHLLYVRGGKAVELLDLATPELDAIIKSFKPVEVVRWQGSDGLEIQGYLAMPEGVERPPLVAFIHGGPSHLFRNAWSADNSIAALLVHFGYAVLFPNPRGSSGRGVDFAERVMGDWGGEDRKDILAGIDHVIAHHSVDPDRLYVTGGSYGGYMTSWLVTQTDRFAAACAVVPLTDMRSFYFTAHHPEFLSLYTAGTPYEVGGIFDERSPLRHADKVTTPTLLIAGGMDNTTPATQASQFYRALALRGVPTQLVVYPQEGHAVTALAAQIDQGVRILQWFGVDA